MFVSGQSPLAAMIFSALTFSVSIPSAIKVFNWLATMYKGSIGLATPMCYALMFIFLFGIGGLTGLFLGTLAIDVHVPDTYFVVAHFHYVMIGGTLIAFLAGLHYWWPKMTGRMYNERLGPDRLPAHFRRLQPHLLPAVHHRHPRHAAALLRLHEAPRRSTPSSRCCTSSPRSVRSCAAVGFILIFGYLLHSLFRGRARRPTPGAGPRLEWQCRFAAAARQFPPCAGRGRSLRLSPTSSTIRP